MLAFVDIAIALAFGWCFPLVGLMVWSIPVLIAFERGFPWRASAIFILVVASMLSDEFLPYSGWVIWLVALACSILIEGRPVIPFLTEWLENRRETRALERMAFSDRRSGRWKL